MAAKRKPTPKILQNKPLMASYEQQTFAAAAQERDLIAQLR